MPSPAMLTNIKARNWYFTVLSENTPANLTQRRLNFSYEGGWNCHGAVAALPPANIYVCFPSSYVPRHHSIPVHHPHRAPQRDLGDGISICVASHGHIQQTGPAGRVAALCGPRAFSTPA